MSDELAKICEAINKSQRKTPDGEEVAMSCLGSIVLILLSPFLAMYYGWGLWLLWNWFVTPIMPGISWHVAVGLMLFAVFIKTKANEFKNDKPISEVFYLTISYCVYVAITVAMGWLFHLAGFGQQPLVP